MRQALLINIWQLSTVLLLTSSPLKLCQVGWWQTHTFRFLQKYLIGFNLRLWLGHSRTFTALCVSNSCCVFRVIVQQEGKYSAQSEVLNTLDWVFINAISIFWCIELSSILFSWVPQSLPLKNSPTAIGCYQHTVLWGGTLHVMSRAGSLQSWCLELRFIRPDKLVSHSLGVL